MQNLNKSGLSNVISVVLIIVLTLSAASIFFAGILQPVSKLSPQLDCKSLQLESIVQIKKACIQDQEIQVTLERNFQQTEIDKINFFASNGEERIGWEAGGPNCQYCDILSQGSTKTYYLRDFHETGLNQLMVSVNECVVESKEIISC